MYVRVTIRYCLLVIELTSVKASWESFLDFIRTMVDRTSHPFYDS